MTTQPSPDLRQAELDAARLLLDRMGITAADLLTTPRQRPPIPTFAEYIPQVSAAVAAGTNRVYGSCWKRIRDRWADRRLDEVTSTDIKQLVEHTKTHTVARRNARGGRSGRCAPRRRPTLPLPTRRGRRAHRHPHAREGGPCRSPLPCHHDASSPRSRGGPVVAAFGTGSST
ncbi:MAG: hypothetical protein H7Y15_08160 [Pseudonocardia sp.]|nr:hypothetical protein [Pseudonocardia sp.]